MAIRADYLFEAPVQHEQADRFHTNMQLPFLKTEEGHEILARAAMGGPGERFGWNGAWRTYPPLPLSPADRQAILYGVVKPDKGGEVLFKRLPEWVQRAISTAITISAMIHVNRPELQAAHSLRRRPNASLIEALGEITAYMGRLYDRASTATSRRDSLVAIGEALHLIQDSYSFAHTLRVRGRGPDGGDTISKVRYYFSTLADVAEHPYKLVAAGITGSIGTAALIAYITRGGTKRDAEHDTPSDDRDIIKWPDGQFKSEAVRAIDVSRWYLEMMLPHVPSSGTPWSKDEHDRFVARWFSPT